MTTTNQPESASGSSEQLLAEEIAFYDANKESLKREHSGRYLLIKGRELINSFESEEEAVTEGIRRFRQSTPFLVRLAGEDTPVLSVPLLAIGMMTQCHQS